MKFYKLWEFIENFYINSIMLLIEELNPAICNLEATPAWRLKHFCLSEITFGPSYSIFEF